MANAAHNYPGIITLQRQNLCSILVIPLKLFTGQMDEEPHFFLPPTRLVLT